MGSTAIVLGWYAPVMILVARDPLAREILLEACRVGAKAVLSSVTHCINEVRHRFFLPHCESTLKLELTRQPEELQSS